MEPSFTERHIESVAERAYIRWQAEQNPGTLIAALQGAARLVRDMDPRLRELLEEEIEHDAKQAEATADKKEWSQPDGPADPEKIRSYCRDIQELHHHQDEKIEAAARDDKPHDAKLSPRDLATKHGVNLQNFNKRLERWRCEHDAGYVEVSNAAKNEPKYLYDESAVIPVIEDMKTKLVGRKRLANVQAKNI